MDNFDLLSFDFLIPSKRPLVHSEIDEAVYRAKIHKVVHPRDVTDVRADASGEHKTVFPLLGKVVKGKENQPPQLGSYQLIETGSERVPALLVCVFDPTMWESTKQELYFLTVPGPAVGRATLTLSCELADRTRCGLEPQPLTRSVPLTDRLLVPFLGKTVSRQLYEVRAVFNELQTIFAHYTPLQILLGETQVPALNHTYENIVQPILADLVRWDDYSDVRKESKQEEVFKLSAFMNQTLRHNLTLSEFLDHLLHMKDVVADIRLFSYHPICDGCGKNHLAGRTIQVMLPGGHSFVLYAECATRFQEFLAFIRQLHFLRFVASLSSSTRDNIIHAIVHARAQALPALSV